MKEEDSAGAALCHEAQDPQEHNGSNLENAGLRHQAALLSGLGVLAQPCSLSLSFPAHLVGSCSELEHGLEEREAVHSSEDMEVGGHWTGSGSPVVAAGQEAAARLGGGGLVGSYVLRHFSEPQGSEPMDGLRKKEGGSQSPWAGN